jgi:hypothetical protein
MVASTNSPTASNQTLFMDDEPERTTRTAPLTPEVEQLHKRQAQFHKKMRHVVLLAVGLLVLATMLLVGLRYLLLQQQQRPPPQPLGTAQPSSTPVPFLLQQLEIFHEKTQAIDLSRTEYPLPPVDFVMDLDQE